MNDIIFRGKDKRIDNRHMIEGILLNLQESTYIVPPNLTCTYDPYDEVINGLPVIEVDPNTIGRFTGITDRNSVRIFEGDIIKWHDNTELSVGGQIAEICYGKYIDADSHFDDVYLLGFYFKLFDKDKTCATISWLDEYKNDFDIIGNIYDNPELINGGK